MQKYGHAQSHEEFAKGTDGATVLGEICSTSSKLDGYDSKADSMVTDAMSRNGRNGLSIGTISNTVAALRLPKRGVCRGRFTASKSRLWEVLDTF